MKVFVCWILVLCLSVGLVACSNVSESETKDTAPTSATAETSVSDSEAEQATEPTEEAIQEPTVRKFNDSGFWLTFPPQWEGRYDIEGSYERKEYTVSADGEAVFTLVAVANVAGARERSLELMADGYEFFNENFEFSYFIKLHSDFPEDLTWNSTGLTGNDPVAFCDAVELFSYRGEQRDEIFRTNYGWVRRGLYNSMLLPEPDAQTYYNYRLDIRLDLPQHLSGKFITPTESALIISNYMDSTFDSDNDLVNIVLYDYDIERKGTAYDAQEDPYLISNQEQGYEAYIPIAEKDSRIYYFRFATSNGAGLNPSRQQIYDAIDDIFTIIE